MVIPSITYKFLLKKNYLFLWKIEEIKNERQMYLKEVYKIFKCFKKIKNEKYLKLFEKLKNLPPLSFSL